jgi:hypothetical protein
MAKTLDFKDFMVVDYAPGMDPIIKRAAKKRKLDAGAGTNAEYSSTYAPDEQIDTIDEGKKLTDTKADWRSDKSATAKNWSHNKLMKVAKHDRSAEKEIKRRIASKEYVFANEEVELDEALNAQQRRLRALQMKRKQPKIELGKERAARRFADKDVLSRRARRAARTRLFQMLTKGIPKAELTYQRRQEIEKRLDSPGMKKAIERIAVKMLPKERQAEIQRHRSGGN